MPDLVVHRVDGLLAERVAALARQRRCSINDIMLEALRSGLGMAAARHCSESVRSSARAALLEGHWEAAERGVFQEALQALATTRPTQLAPENLRYDMPVLDAE